MGQNIVPHRLLMSHWFVPEWLMPEWLVPQRLMPGRLVSFGLMSHRLVSCLTLVVRCRLMPLISPAMRGWLSSLVRAFSIIVTIIGLLDTISAVLEH